MEPSKAKAALYIRVSTEEQALEGQSVDAQIETLTQYCKLYDIEIYNIYRDLGVSGKSAKNRPGLQQMLRDAAMEKFNMVLVWKISRLSRSLKDLLLILDQLDKHGIAFTSYSEKFDTTTPVGRMTLQLLGSIAEFERNTIIDNVKLGLREYARKGGKTGTILGYDSIDKQLIINQQEAETVRLIYKLYVIDNMNMEEIANYLNKYGYKTKRGKSFRKDAVSFILSNPAYIGINRHKTGTSDEYEIRGTHQPLIDIGTWEAAKEQRHANKNMRLRKSQGNSSFVLSGKLICKECKSPIIGFSTRSAEKIYRYYKCKNCRYLINAAMLEEKVSDLLIKLLNSSQIGPTVHTGGNNGTPIDNQTYHLQQIEGQIKCLSTQLDKYAALLTINELSKSQLIINKITIIDEKISMLQKEKMSIELNSRNSVSKPAPIDIQNKIIEIYKKGDKSQFIKTLSNAIEHVEIDKENCKGEIFTAYNSESADSHFFDF